MINKEEEDPPSLIHTIEEEVAPFSFFVSSVGAIKEEIAPLSSPSSFSSITSIAAIKEADNKEGEDDHSSLLLSSPLSVVHRKTHVRLLCAAALQEE